VSLKTSGRAALAVAATALIASAHLPAAGARSYPIAGRTVVIDPGHGGIDPGACGHGLLEADINLAVGRLLADRLSQAGIVVVLARGTRHGILGRGWRGKNRQRAELEARTNLGNQVAADAYLSVHCNAWHGGGVARGAQVFIDPNSSPASELLAKEIMAALTRGTGTRRKLSQRINHYVLKNVHVPVVTIEMGFVTDAEDARRLADPDYRRRLADLIALAVLRYLAEVPYSGPPSDADAGSSATPATSAAAWMGPPFLVRREGRDLRRATGPTRAVAADPGDRTPFAGGEHDFA
jgi:N-acetylmuramoyl-L-alanine amidase